MSTDRNYNNLVLDKGDSALPENLRNFLATVPGGKIVFVEAEVSESPAGYILEGECRDVWPVAGLEGKQLALSHMRIEEGNGVIKGIAKARMNFTAEKTEAVDVVSDDGEGHPWKITLTESVSDLSATEIICSATNIGIPFALPAGMDFLNDGVQIDAKEGYFILFYPDTSYESYAEFKGSIPSAVWEPVPAVFKFNGIDFDGVTKSSSFGLTLTGHFAIGGIKTDAGISMSGSKYWRVFVKPTPPDVQFPGLAALAAWIGGETLLQDIAEGFADTELDPTGFDAALSGISAEIDIQAFSLRTLRIDSILTLGALKLDIGFLLPQLLISGNLHEQTPLKVVDLLKSLSLPADTIPDNLEVSTADFSADLRNSIYSVGIAVKFGWKAGPFTFEEIGLTLVYDEISKLTGTFSCGFTIGGAPMLLMAEYGGKEAGWVFSGGLSPYATLKIEDVLNMLENDFDVKEVPEPVRDLTLTKLWIAYSSATNNFEFVCEGTFVVDDIDVLMSVVIRLEETKQSYKAFFSGRLSIDKLVFDVVFQKENKDNTFIAAYHHEGDGKEPLRDLVAGVSVNLAGYIPPGLVIDLKEVKFIYFKEAEVKRFAFGLQLNVAVDLNQLPVIGEKLPAGMVIRLDDLQVLYTSAAFSAVQVGIVNPLLPEEILKLDAQGLPKGLLITGVLNVCGWTLEIDTGRKEKSVAQPVAAYAFVGEVSVTAVAPSDITWFNVRKQLGPVDFQRIGLAFADNVLSFALDVSLKLGPAVLNMQGLTVGSPLDRFEPVMGIQGFFMDLKTGSFELGGGFLKSLSPDGATAYYGAVMIQCGPFGLKALGGDTPAHEADDPDDPGHKIGVPASFFLYANVELPLGGPPFFYIKGFAGGFGINNLLVLPTLQELPGYILLPGSKAPKQGKTAEETIRQVLPQLQKYFIPQPGQYWMAAGISFSSFEMINAFAVATVSFGVDLRVALLGSCSMSFPKGMSHPIAYVEIAIMAVFSEKDGFFAVEGILSPASFIFGDFCHISGGFAFYIWFNPPLKEGGPKKGEFLVSLGGYYPHYTPPSYYPVLPRLGIRFCLGPFQVVGQAYFALTSGMFMAGGMLSATWDLYVIKAWFTVEANFLIAWAPFHYETEIMVYVGCKVDLGIFRFNVSIGAYLQLWGPPFGGKAEIDLGVLAFTISFGGKQVMPEPVGWQDFKGQFLPADSAAKGIARQSASVTNVLKATVPEGLNKSDCETVEWVLDPDRFRILAATTMPVSVLCINGEEIGPQAGEKNWNPEVNIRPMNLAKVKSLFVIELLRKNNAGEYVRYKAGFDWKAELENVPVALWGKPLDGAVKVDEDGFVESALTGVSLLPLSRVPSMVNEVQERQLLYQQNHQYDYNYQSPLPDNDYSVEVSGRDTDELAIGIHGQHEAVLMNKGYILSALADGWVSKRRDSILQNLTGMGWNTYEKSEMEVFAKETVLTDWPEVVRLVENES